MKIAGAVLAAGQSSRMGAFKPLLKLNGRAMVDMTADSMRNAGVCRICIVLGRNADEMKEHLSSSIGVRTAVNEKYAQTDMLASIKIALAEIKDADMAFILPADIPVIAPSVFIRLREAMKDSTDADAACPVFEGRGVHPVLLRSGCFKDILSYEGSEGLRGVLRSLRTIQVPVDDPGTLRDADHWEDYEYLRGYAKTHTGLSRELCYEYWDRYELPEHIRRHCTKTAETAVLTAKILIRSGMGLDISLIESSALLHDLCRTQKNHENAAADILRDDGYHAIAEIIRAHQNLDNETDPVLDERSVVFLADKFVQEDRLTTLENRYAPALEKYGGTEDIAAGIKLNLSTAQKLKEQAESVIKRKLFY